jgi:hypothetical protein
MNLLIMMMMFTVFTANIFAYDIMTAGGDEYNNVEIIRQNGNKIIIKCDGYCGKRLLKTIDISKLFKSDVKKLNLSKYSEFNTPVVNKVSEIKSHNNNVKKVVDTLPSDKIDESRKLDVNKKAITEAFSNKIPGCNEILNILYQHKIHDGNTSLWYGKNLKGNYKLFNCGVYYAKIHESNSKIDYALFIFTNKGDNVKNSNGQIYQLMRDKVNVRDSIKNESQIINRKMSILFEKSKRKMYGKGKVKEQTDLWSDEKYIYLLSAPNREYTSLKIISKDILSSKGNTLYIPIKISKKQLLNNVIHQSNGNVIIKVVPMIDQGSKGYCTPAIWTRYLNYLGFYIDMYTLAQKGTGPGGGTIPLKMKYTINSILNSHRMKARGINSYMPKIDTVATYIDQGLPVVWHIVKHTRMIIGYNKKTDKIAYTDSWGTGHEEKWMKVSDALKITSRYLMEVIDFIGQ